MLLYYVIDEKFRGTRKYQTRSAVDERQNEPENEQLTPRPDQNTQVAPDMGSVELRFGPVFHEMSHLVGIMTETANPSRQPKAFVSFDCTAITWYFRPRLGGRMPSRF